MDYECVLYFDYITGDILKCFFGLKNKVLAKYDENEFRGKHIASIHNHINDVFSPPSGKNFNIFQRDFEDYELISSENELWILKGKCVNERLVVEMNIASDILFKSSLKFCADNFSEDEIENKCNELYGIQLLKYINDKKIKDIQLTKKEFINMSIESNEQIAEYESFKKIRDPDIIRLAREEENDSNFLSGKEMVYSFYKLMGMEIEYEDIFKLD